MPLSYTDRHPQDPNLMGYNSFELGGFEFRAWQPANDDAKRELVLEVWKGEELVLTERTPMFHENRFGVDMEDAHALNERVEVVVKDLGLE